MRVLHQSKKKAHLGLSIIELLISLVLGTLLLGTVLSIFSSSKLSYLIQSKISRSQDNALFTISTINRELQKIGFTSNVSDPIGQIFPEDIVAGFQAGQVLSGQSNSLKIRYMGAASGSQGEVFDCLGNQLSAGQLEVIQLSLSNQNIECTKLEPAPTDKQNIGGNIGSLQFQYGVDTNNDGYADVYKTSTSNSDSVVSIKYTFTTQTKLDSQSSSTVSRTYTQVTTLRNPTQ